VFGAPVKLCVRQCSVYTQLILPSFFGFHCAVLFFDDHDACSVKHEAAVGGGWAFAVCVLCAWCMRGKTRACKISKHPFNFSLSSWVCVYVLFWQEMTSAHNEAVVHRSVEGMPKGSAHPSTAKNTKTLGVTLDQLGS